MTNSKQKVVNTKSVLTAPNHKRLGAYLIDNIFIYFVHIILFYMLPIFTSNFEVFFNLV